MFSFPERSEYEEFLKSGGSRDGKIHFIITHFNPHLDEWAVLVFILVFKSLAERVWPGISDARVVCVSANYQLPSGFKSCGDSLEAIGILPVGVLGGRVDEHAYGDIPAKSGQCAFELFCRIIGIDRRPEMRNIIRAVRLHDVCANANDLNIGVQYLASGVYKNDFSKVLRWIYRGLVAKMSDRNVDCSLQRINLLMLKRGDNSAEAMDWYLEGMNTFVESEKNFDQAKAEFAKSGELHRVKQFKIGVAKSDQEIVSHVIRSKNGADCDIAIIQNTQGNVCILSNAKKNKKLELVFQSLSERLAEEDPDRWYFFKSGPSLLNGNSRSDTEPTRLELATITEMVCKALDPSK